MVIQLLLHALDNLIAYFNSPISCAITKFLGIIIFDSIKSIAIAIIITNIRLYFINCCLYYYN